MLQPIDLRASGVDPAAALAPVRSTVEAGDLDAVRAILAEVRRRGDGAIRDLTRRFDGCELEELRVPAADLAFALAALPGDVRAALEVARDRIARYHEAQRAGEGEARGAGTADDGVALREVVRPVRRAGCYVPGGRATYPSTVLMTAIPAQVAEVPEIALCVPPDATGRVAAPTLAAAALLGLDEVYAIGGAQAIGALAYGTESVPAVDLIVGPGNRFVALAKREVFGTVGIDSFAGGSELAVVADDSADPALVAADLLAQAEHGPGGLAVLVTWSEPVVAAVEDALARALGSAGRADDIAATLQTGGYAVLAAGPVEAMQAVDEIAPEHVELLTADPEALVPLVHHAGAVFCGPWSPTALGDYVAGANHVLPTGRTARFASALRVATFQRHTHVVTATREGFRALAPHVIALAEAEGLAAHAASITAREPS